MISFSGIDCSGKTTQIELVSQQFSNLGIKYEVIWSRGGYTPMISYLKNKLFKRSSLTLEEIKEYSQKVNQHKIKRKLLLIASLLDLAIYYSIVLRIKEIFGTQLICDRYIWDTYIDFKIKYPESNFENGILWKNLLKTMIKPKLSFLLKIPAEVSIYRSSLKDEPFPESIDIRKTRISMYLTEAKKGKWCYQVDASEERDLVFQFIWEKIVEKYLHQNIKPIF
jgi:dTMP kinase